MQFHAQSKLRVLDDLVEKLRRLPPNHPERPRLIRMIIDLRGEIDRWDDAANVGFAADN